MTSLSKQAEPADRYMRPREITARTEASEGSVASSAPDHGAPLATCGHHQA
jgi:hypothetical protein